MVQTDSEMWVKKLLEETKAIKDCSSMARILVLREE